VETPSLRVLPNVCQLVDVALPVEQAMEVEEWVELRNVGRRADYVRPGGLAGEAVTQC
jgi:hypothetical protein